MSLFHALSDYATRVLPASASGKLRTGYLSARRHLAPLERAIWGTFDTATLRDHLAEQIGTDFDVLMVHSSMNGLQVSYRGTPLELVRMLVDYCAPSRTLAMPAFYFGDPDIGNVHETFSRNPVCNLRRTPSQMGLATEVFRRSKGVVQSRHPVYRVAAHGPLAEELVRGHEHCDGPSGFGSPFDFMAQRDTQIIGIGKSFHVLTQAHFAETVLGDEFPVPRKPRSGKPRTVITVQDRGEEVEVRLGGGGGLLWRFDITRLPSLLPPGVLRCWKFHNVPMCAARAKPLTDALVDAARRGETLYVPR